jgi:DNA-3-methyladenine glycosylase II
LLADGFYILDNIAMYSEAQKHLASNDVVLAALIARYGDCTIKPHKDYYPELVSSIISQQLSVKAASTIYNRFLELCGGKLPTPEFLLTVPAESLRQIGCSYAKASYIHDLAQHIIDGRLDLDHISTLPNEEVIKQLVAVKGIGEWSAHMFMIFSLGRLDILPTGDLGVRKAVQQQYCLAELSTPAEMKEIAAKNNWAPYESVASWYLWRSLDNK